MYDLGIVIVKQDFYLLYVLEPESASSEKNLIKPLAISL
jgi:hypothetical protein